VDNPPGITHRNFISQVRAVIIYLLLIYVGDVLGITRTWFTTSSDAVFYVQN